MAGLVIVVSSILTESHTHTHTHTHTDAYERLTPATIVSMSNDQCTHPTLPLMLSVKLL